MAVLPADSRRLRFTPLKLPHLIERVEIMPAPLQFAGLPEAVMGSEDVGAEIAAWPAQDRVGVVGVGLVEFDQQVPGLDAVIMPVIAGQRTFPGEVQIAGR